MLSEAIDQFRSPSFWVTSFAFALVIEVLGSYLRDWLDSLRGKLAETKKARLEADLRRQRRVGAIVESSELLADLRHRELRERFHVAMFGVLAVLLLLNFPSELLAARRWWATALAIGPLVTVFLGVVISFRRARQISDDVNVASDIRFMHERKE